MPISLNALLGVPTRDERFVRRRDEEQFKRQKELADIANRYLQANAEQGFVHNKALGEQTIGGQMQVQGLRNQGEMAQIAEEGKIRGTLQGKDIEARQGMQATAAQNEAARQATDIQARKDLQRGQVGVLREQLDAQRDDDRIRGTLNPGAAAKAGRAAELQSQAQMQFLESLMNNPAELLRHFSRPKTAAELDAEFQSTYNKRKGKSLFERMEEGDEIPFH